jgi:succinate-semialdehyde dehydrogenase / glutarate-semialdehyde dehydrogenase
MHTDQFINGQFVKGSAHTVALLDPATEDQFAEVTTSSVEDCLSALDAANQAFSFWAATAPRVRGEVLRRAFELMTAEADAVARLIVKENGKALLDARSEVTYAAEFFRWYSEEACRIDGDYRRAPGGANWIMVSRSPVGPALLLTPWNFPAAMATRKIGPALAAGCTVVLKPAMETPLTAVYLADLLSRAGAPPGTVNVIVPDPPGDAVAALIGDRRLRKLSFTGSTRVGSLLLGQASRRVVNCSMELGGNAPFVVFADADIDAAIDGAMIAKMRNAGAACTAANRFYVEAAVADEFTSKLTARMVSLVVGPGTVDGVQVGPLVSAAQRDRVDAAIAGATAHGARVVGSGIVPDGPGYWSAPTVLADVAYDNPVLAEEIFGPVAPIVMFDDHDEMATWCNNVDHGLVSYVYSQDINKAMRLAERLETGMVGLNRGLVSDPAAPFGGVKASGLGREGGHEGLLAFTETKYVAGVW